MSIVGFKKQISKANQYMSEKIGGAKGTELDDEFIEMEKKTDVLSKLVDELMSRTHELLQPNPVSRSKMASVKAVSKLRGTTNTSLYPQVEGQLGDCMIKYGRELGNNSLFGQALVESGESYKQLAEVKYQLEDNVKQNFIEPLHHLQDKDLKEVNHHRKKLSGRRLDYDCKRRKQQKGASVTDEELRQAEEKFEESKEITEAAMHNLLDNDFVDDTVGIMCNNIQVEQISQLASFLEAELNYYQQSVDILQSLLESVRRKCNDAASRPRSEHVVKRVTSVRSTGSSISDRSQSYNSSNYDMSQNDYKTAPVGSGYHTASKPDPYQSQSASANYVNKDNVKEKKERKSEDLLINLNDSEPVYSTVVKKSQRNGARPSAKALYDFDPENEGELGFREGDIINLTSRIDENWIEGEVRGQTGFFPITYVQILVDLPPE